MLRKKSSERMKLTEEELDILKDSISEQMMTLIEKKDEKTQPIIREYQEEIDRLEKACDEACRVVEGELNDKIKTLDGLLTKLGGKKDGNTITKREEGLESAIDSDLDSPRLRRFGSGNKHDSEL